MIKKINNKAELTTTKIVALIVLIASFAIILFLLFRLNLGATTDKEICHNSVVLKSKAEGLVGMLDCKTNYLCISGGGECEGISPIITTKVNSKNKEEIMKVIADEMVDCWWMFGEGELNYMGADLKGDHCAVCSTIKFDSMISEEFPEISYSDFYGFLVNTQKSNAQTYLKYLYGVSSVNAFQSEYSMKGVDVTEENFKIFTEDKFVIITGINPNFLKKGGIIPPYFIKYDEVRDRTSCDIFDITKS